MAQRPDALDLSYLASDPDEVPKPPRSGDVISKGSVGKDFYSQPKVKRPGKSLGAVESGLSRLRYQPIPKAQKVEDAATVDVRCNYVKDRSLLLSGGDLVLTFDEHGIAKMPVYKLPLLQAVQRSRPGRFTILSKEAEVKIERESEKQFVKEIVPEVIQAVVKEEVVLEEKPVKKKTSKKAKKENKILAEKKYEELVEHNPADN